MTTEELKTKVFGKTETGERYTFRQWIIYVWAGLSLAILGVVNDAPLWVYGLLLANFATALHNINKLPLPEDTEKDLDDYETK